MEKINFKIDLKIITHKDVSEHPFVNISINGFPQFGEILESNKTVDIDFEIEDETENFLTIEYTNKNAKKDVILDKDGLPRLDKRVEIVNIFIEDVPLDFHSLLDPSVLTYTPFDKEGYETNGFDATKLAWNGKTTLHFTTPVYIWLLENL